MSNTIGAPLHVSVGTSTSLPSRPDTETTQQAQAMVVEYVDVQAQQKAVGKQLSALEQVKAELDRLDAVPEEKRDGNWHVQAGRATLMLAQLKMSSVMSGQGEESRSDLGEDGKSKKRAMGSSDS